MKEFLRTLAASLVAQILFAGVGLVLFFIVMVSLASMGSQVPTVPKKAVLIFDLSTNIPDSSQESDPSQAIQRAIQGGRSEGTPLLTLIKTLERAASDKDIAGLYLTGNLQAENYGSGYGALVELKEAIRAFQASGKPVLAYNQNWSKREYYLCAGVGTIYCNPMGVVEFTAPQAEMLFMAGFFKKYGIECQVTRVGKYKSAVEPYLLDKMSPENREQYQKLLEDFWVEWKASVAADRKSTPEGIQKLSDEKGLMSASEAKEAGLVDKVAYYDEVLDELKRLAGKTEKDTDFPQIDLTEYAKIPGDAKRGGNRVAVLYAEGTIVDGEGRGPQVGGDRVSQALRKLRLDDKVKAVVLRVNSPGGSALASDLIQREVIATRKVKPVVISMGTVAASGGYWISAYGSRIFAEPNTLTGSIGVFGMIPNIKKLANDHGFTTDGIQMGKLGLPSITKPMSPEELARLQTLVDTIYDQFLEKVAEGRNLKKEAVHEIAQGRVWSGKEALKLGLVDEIGGLQDAIKCAAQLAKIEKDYRFDMPEAPLPPVERFLKALGAGDKHKRVDGGLGAQIRTGLEHQIEVLNSFNDPRGVYALMPFEATVR